MAGMVSLATSGWTEMPCLLAMLQWCCGRQAAVYVLVWAWQSCSSWHYTLLTYLTVECKLRELLGVLHAT